jgi:hypothetical protein
MSCAHWLLFSVRAWLAFQSSPCVDYSESFQLKMESRLFCSVLRIIQNLRAEAARLSDQAFIWTVDLRLRMRNVARQDRSTLLASELDAHVGSPHPDE